MTTLRDGDLLQVVNSPQGYTISWADLKTQFLTVPGALGCIEQTFTVGQFTDVGAGVGRLDLSTTVPVGSRLLNCSLYISGAFLGDVTAVVTVGDGTDVDRFNTGTPSVFTAGHKDMGAVSGTAYVATAITPRVTITTASEFGAAQLNGTGRGTIRLNYLQPASTS
jgi:hypothetical protein